MVSDNINPIAKSQNNGSNFSFNPVRILISILFLIACIICVYFGYLLVSQSAYNTDNLTGYFTYNHNTVHPRVVYITDLISYVSGIGLVVSGFMSLMVIITLWSIDGYDKNYYINCYKDKKDYLANPNRRGLFIFIKRKMFSVIDHINNKSICGLIFASISGIALTIIVGVCVAYLFGIIDNIYLLLIGIILVPVILGIIIYIALQNAESGKQYFQEKDDNKYEISENNFQNKIDEQL